MKRERVWYLVMNSHRARILRGLPRPGEPTGEELVIEAPAVHMRDHRDDRPGRAFASSGARRSAMEPATNPVREEERQFLARVDEALEDAAQRGDFDALVVFASPEILGLWRDTRPEPVAARIREEEVSNIANLTPPELVQRIRQHGAA